jgi:acyl carrier protein
MALTEQEILVGLGEILDEVAGVPADQVTPEKTFIDDLDIDSLSMVEIAVAAQDRFEVEIPDDHLRDRLRAAVCRSRLTGAPGDATPRHLKLGII